VRAALISSFALKFGPPEFFAVYLLTFCSFWPAIDCAFGSLGRPWRPAKASH
jgi:TctA family transporter